MVTDHKDHCVKNVTANQLPTITDVAIKFITGKNVIHVLEKATVHLLQRQRGNVQDTLKINLAKCVALQHSILIN